MSDTAPVREEIPMVDLLQAIPGPIHQDEIESKTEGKTIHKTRSWAITLFDQTFTSTYAITDDLEMNEKHKEQALRNLHDYMTIMLTIGGQITSLQASLGLLPAPLPDSIMHALKQRFMQLMMKHSTRVKDIMEPSGRAS